MPKGVYIHIPFCKRICSYCDFCKVLYNEKWIKKYLEALNNEINDRYLGEDIETIYIGGGTPSSLSINYLEELFKIVSVFKKNNLKEFTFECNIDDISESLLNILSKNGVNRLSIGIESFNKDNLKVMNRVCDYKDASKKIKLIRSYGFKNINLDLIYALPNESIKTLLLDLKKLLKLKPEHISTYSLMIEEHTVLKNNNISPISEDIDASMYNIISKVLKIHGFKHYEVSNFCKKGFESIHNLKYWNNEEYYGFGCGASGYIESVRYDNTKNLNKYLNGIVNGEDILITKDKKMEYELMLGLRKTSGINIKDFYKKYGMELKEVFPIIPLLKNKDLIQKKGYIFINPKKFYIMNEILTKLV